jgi:hypothetical protein
VGRPSVAASPFPLVPYVVFGCIELVLGIELEWNTKTKVERKWPLIPILLFGCVWYLLLESKGASNSNFCLDVQAKEFDVLISLDNIKLCRNIKIVYVYIGMFISPSHDLSSS